MTDIPHGEVTIADLFRVLLGIQTGMAELGTEVKVLAAQLQAQSTSSASGIEGNAARLADHETRLRLLETARSKLVGAAGVAGVLAGSVGGAVVAHFVH